jgi:hypothetical protein
VKNQRWRFVQKDNGLRQGCILVGKEARLSTRERKMLCYAPTVSLASWWKFSDMLLISLDALPLFSDMIPLLC